MHIYIYMGTHSQFLLQNRTNGCLRNLVGMKNAWFHTCVKVFRPDPTRGESKSGEKGSDLTQSYDKRPYTRRQIQNPTLQHKNETKNFNYTTIADRLILIETEDQQPTKAERS